MAAPVTDSPDVTWRDAVTPLSRASRRRWTACYAVLLTLAAASVVDDTFAVSRGSGDEMFPLLLLVAIPVVFGMLRRGTRRIAALDHPGLDERDVAARNSAYRIAFPLLGLVVVAALVLLAVSVPGIVQTERAGQATVGTDGLFVEPNALLGIGLWIVLWAVFLPTGVLAWREPDALEAEDGGGRLSEPVRDALLGFALAGGLALVVLADSDAGGWTFIATLALLGGLGRRAAGQPMMSRQRKWRVAIGLGLLTVIVVVALVAGAAGG